MIKAVAYLRTSSAANVGEDKDSEDRQREAITRYAARAKVEIIDWYYDAAVRGDHAVTARPGFVAMMDRIAGNGVHTIIVETASRFARDLIVQETGHKMLRDQGITLIAADSPEVFVEETPTTILIRQVLGAVSQFEKANLVAKLRGARERKRRLTGKKVGGAPNYAEINPGMVDRAKALAANNMTLRAVADQLAKDGFFNKMGGKHTAKNVSRMLARG